MANILEELYYGNISPYEAGFSKNSRYAKKLNELVNCQKKLNDVLDENEKKYFSEFCDAQSELSGITAARNFIYGFRLGAKMIIETTEDHDDLY